MNTATSPAKKSFKTQMLEARELAITASVNRLLSEKGFDAMTVDEVAAEVGIAKASLYKHFSSKEELACAAMVQAMQKAQAFLENLNQQNEAGDLADSKRVSSPCIALNKLMATTRWTLQLKLAGEMPTLPSQNSSLRATLMASRPYMDGLMTVSDLLGSWIVQAQQEGFMNPALPPIAILYTLYARACDPVVEFLKMSELHSDEEIIEMVMTTCFAGLNARL
ncbi:MAG: Nucleoid occlusion factor SlmA [Pseudomonadota bacterium]|jgi:TetR/AcrR family transcriptional regulator of autoinduction and epiphytic fitness